MPPRFNVSSWLSGQLKQGGKIPVHANVTGAARHVRMDGNFAPLFQLPCLTILFESEGGKFVHSGCWIGSS